jgi:hypothetical protein
MTIFLFLIALVVGGIASWQIFNWMYAGKLRDNRDQIRQEATVLLERIEKVCKVVVAEGYFSEIYDHNSQQEFLLFWNTHKKALIVTRAKVSVGFDFAKIKTRRDETSRKMIIEQMPPAEVISIDTDYKFYDINQGWLSKFKHEEYTNMLAEAKRIMNDKALSSDLPAIANRQMNVMIHQLAATMSWELEMPNATNQIAPIALPKVLALAEKAEFEELPPV